jgi:hypothetical protein
MPFFFIVPVCLACDALGVVLLFFAKWRRLGCFVIAVPTGATVVSFLLSTAVFFVAPKLAPQPPRLWYGALILISYFSALVLGGLIGAFAAFLLVLRMQRPSQMVRSNSFLP